ncbi:MAG: hypothetical protein CL908_02090 [Deltaproteobacteria bacterium]|nr:hypothetical protein [Deltaproteobacteria bacterium]
MHRSQLLADVEAVHARQHHVEHDERRHPLGIECSLEPQVAACRAFWRIALEGEHIAESTQDRFLVFHDEDGQSRRFAVLAFHGRLQV